MKCSWRVILGLGSACVALAGMVRVGRAETVDATDKELRALVQDVRGYLRRLDRTRPREAAEAQREIANGARNLAAERAAWRRAGLPLTRAELKMPALPPEQDAAPIYREFVRLLQAQPLDPQLTQILADLDRRRPHTGEQTTALRTLLEDRHDVMALIHQAGDRPGCSLRSDWGQLEGALWREMSAMRQAVRLLRAESSLLARDGQADAAIANETRALRIADHAGCEPLMANYLVMIACHRIALDGMADVLLAPTLDAKGADAVGQAVRTQQPRLDARRALTGESVFLALGMQGTRKELRETGTDCLRRAFHLDFAEWLNETETGRRTPKQGKQAAPEELQLWGGILDAVEARLLRQRRTMIAAQAKPYAERQAILEQMARTNDTPSRSPVHLVVSAWGTVYSGADTKKLLASTQVAVLTAAAAVVVYQRRQGRWPERLAQALPQPPVDPFNGQPLQYRPTGDGFHIESVGKEDRSFTATAGAGTPIAFGYPAPAVSPLPSGARPSAP